MRLVCLYSVVNNGLKPSVYDSLKTELINAYGIELLFTLENLYEAGLFKTKQGLKFFHSLHFKRLGVIMF